MLVHPTKNILCLKMIVFSMLYSLQLGARKNRTFANQRLSFSTISHLATFAVSAYTVCSKSRKLCLLSLVVFLAALVLAAQFLRESLISNHASSSSLRFRKTTGMISVLSNLVSVISYLFLFYANICLCIVSPTKRNPSKISDRPKNHFFKDPLPFSNAGKPFSILLIPMLSHMYSIHSTNL